MQTHSNMIVTSISLIEEDDRDAGLVHVIAESVHNEAIQSVTFLGNLADGWQVGQKVTTNVWWLTDDPGGDDDEVHTLERPFSADGLNPAAFTEQSVNGARYVEPDTGPERLPETGEF